MKPSISRLAGAFALCAGLAACTTVPGDPYYETPYYPAYQPQPVYIYNQPPLIRPYPVAPPPPVYYGRPYDDDRRGWNHPPAANDRWRDRDNGRDRDNARDRDRADRDRRDREDRERHDREAQRGRPPERVQPPPPPPAQSPDRVWRDARPPSQGQSAEDNRGRGARPSDPTNR